VPGPPQTVPGLHLFLSGYRSLSPLLRPTCYVHDMSDVRESSGRTISFWMSHEEIDALGKKAEKEKVTRNEAGRRAVRAYVKSSVANR
jgi:hypothetical protein